MRLTLPAALLLGACGALSAADPLRVYYIGNSVTDTVRYEGLARLAEARGIRVEWSRHMIPGSPLFLLWRGDGGFVKDAYGPSRRALAEFPWDIVTVQPFDRKLVPDGAAPDPEKSEHDDVIIQQMIEAQVRKNPGVQFYVYSRWPRMRGADGKGFEFDKNDYDPAQPGRRPDFTQAMDWTAAWERKYTGGWDGTEESRDYFEQVVARLRRNNPSLEKPVRMIPVGDVFLALHRKMQAGKVPGFDTIWLLYKDGIHMNRYGSYLTALTFFATMFGQTPVGLPVGDYGDISPELATLFQETVWETVSTHPLAGLK